MPLEIGPISLITSIDNLNASCIRSDGNVAETLTAAGSDDRVGNGTDLLRSLIAVPLLAVAAIMVASCLVAIAVALVGKTESFGFMDIDEAIEIMPFGVAVALMGIAGYCSARAVGWIVNGWLDHP